MKSNVSLTTLAASAGKAHGAVVAGAVQAFNKKGGPSLSLKGALDQLRDVAKLPKQDYDKLSQIVALAADKPTRPVQETLLQIRQVDEELQRKPERVHPLVLAISSIANDSATNALAASTPKSNGARTSRKSVTTTIKVVAADIAGAILGGIAGAKATKEVDIIIAAAIGGAIFASSTVGAGKPFPGIGVAIIVE